MELSFAVVNVRAEAHAAVPTLTFRLRIMAGRPVQAILLRCQLQIEPRRRRHGTEERERLSDVFGASERWNDTLKPLLWTSTSLTVPAFDASVEVDLALPCTYDFEVTAARYLQSLEGGEVPLLFLFSGTVFAKAENGFRVEQVPWDKEASFRLPVAVWRDLMEAYYPGCAWIRLRRESIDALQRFRNREALMSLDEAIEALIGVPR
jgi:hypothetical protein